MAGRFTNLFVALGLGAVLVSTAACGGNDPSSDKPTVAVSLFPLEEIARRIGGDLVSIVALTPAGVDAHNAELTAKQLDALGGSDLILYLGDNFQPTIERAIDGLPASTARIDLLDHVTLLDAGEEDDADSGHAHESEHGVHDPHVWLDPRNMETMAETVASAIEAMVGDRGAAAVRSNVARYLDELRSLDDDMESGLAECTTRTLVTSHDAFGYLAARYRLVTMSVTGLNPDEDPSARQLEDLADAARTAGVRTIFFETMLPRDMADAVARTIGANTDVLDPIEGISRSAESAGATYSSIQRDNLRRLRQGLECT